MESFHYVYILQSRSESLRHYVGLTDNLSEHLSKHNRGEVTHTSKHCPWEIITAIAFRDRFKAAKFERYLKTGSGRAFAKHHFCWFAHPWVGERCRAVARRAEAGHVGCKLASAGPASSRGGVRSDGIASSH